MVRDTNARNNIITVYAIVGLVVLSIAFDRTGLCEEIDLWAGASNGVLDAYEILQTCPDDITAVLNSERDSSLDYGRLMVNGVSLPPIGLCLYNQSGLSTTISTGMPEWDEFIEGQIDLVHESGMNYISLNMFNPTAYNGPAFPSAEDLLDEHNWNWRMRDAMLDYAAQQGVSIIMKMNVHSFPHWWMEQYPEEQQTDQYGDKWDVISFGNEEYREIIGKIILTIVERYQNHPAVLGWDVRVGSTSENNYAPPYTVDILNPPTTVCDYSDGALARFHEWLRNRYETDAALQAAWGDESVTLDAAAMPEPLEDLETSSPLDVIPYINTAGDSRRSFYDWTKFRLEQKNADAFYFGALVRQQDPNHIVITDPAFAPLQLVDFKSGQNDGSLYYQSDVFDGINLHPRIGHEDESRNFNQSRFGLYSFNRYTRHNNKLGFWSMEETSEMISDIDEDNLWKLKSIMAMNAATGIGHGMVSGNEDADDEDKMLPAWSSVEFDEFKKYRSIFSAPNLAPGRAGVAVLSDETNQGYYYWLSGNLRPMGDRVTFLESLFDQALDYDVITSEEIIANPDVVDQFQAVMAIDLPRLPLEAANILAAYRDGGGGLFIGGMTGIYDIYGNPDASSLEALLGASISEFNQDAAAISAWGFDGDDPLLDDMTLSRINNMYYIPKFDLEASGYEALGHLLSDPDAATVGRKDKTVFWFPKISIDKPEIIDPFQQNLWELWGVSPLAIAEDGVEACGGNYRFVFTRNTVDVTVPFEPQEADAGTLVWDWLSMAQVDIIEAGETAEAHFTTSENESYFLGFTPMTQELQLVAAQGAYIDRIERNDNNNRLSAALYRATLPDEITVVVYSGDQDIESVGVVGGELIDLQLNDTETAWIIRVRPSNSVLTINAYTFELVNVQVWELY